MALTSYLFYTTRLLQNPAAPTPLYATADLTAYINQARTQLAAEAECIRVMGNLTVTQAAGYGPYQFASIALPGTPATTGVGSVANVRQAWYQVGSGQKRVTIRPFEWFSLYNMNTAAPATGSPSALAQYGQGGNGTLYVSPPPDSTYVLPLDCVCWPVLLVDDTTIEAIPYMWTDAVPYYAAYLALLSAQTGVRAAEADKMLQRYEQFISRARSGATPSVLPWQAAQVPNPVRAGQLGQQAQPGQGGQGG